MIRWLKNLTAEYGARGICALASVLIAGAVTVLNNLPVRLVNR